MKFLDLSDEAIEHAQNFERLPSATRKLVKETVAAAVKEDVEPPLRIATPSVYWGRNDGADSCLSLVVRGYVNAN